MDNEQKILAELAAARKEIGELKSMTDEIGNMVGQILQKVTKLDPSIGASGLPHR